MLTNSDLDEIEKIMDEKMGERFGLLPTKDDFYGKMDEVMGELKVIREEQTLMSTKFSEHSDQLNNHEERITNLESKSPVKI